MSVLLSGQNIPMLLQAGERSAKNSVVKKNFAKWAIIHSSCMLFPFLHFFGIHWMF
jgi:hypothetical protein